MQLCPSGMRWAVRHIRGAGTLDRPVQRIGRCVAASRQQTRVAEGEEPARWAHCWGSHSIILDGTGASQLYTSHDTRVTWRCQARPQLMGAPANCDPADNGTCVRGRMEDYAIVS